MTTSQKLSLAVAMGDGIGPEITEATLRVLNASGISLDMYPIEMGEKVYLSGNTSGISAESWNTLSNIPILLKGPITTPQGGGYKSLNVTLRKTLNLFANVRPVRSLYPYIGTNHPNMDLVIVRENEEDLYAGIEHQQTQDVVQSLKIVSRPGCERIIRYAFEYARTNLRKKVTCMTKDNIMKLTDGLFHKVFKEIAREYPDINHDHLIIDIGAARLASQPERFDVVVTLNLYGDILSDIAADIAGSVGLAGSSNIGPNFAMFEAIHGSAPDIAGKGIANPSGLLNAAIMMLEHTGHYSYARKIHRAWFQTLKDGIHTADIFFAGYSKRKVGTHEFADAIIERLVATGFENEGQEKKQGGYFVIPSYQRPRQQKELVGQDVFICWEGTDPTFLGQELEQLAGERLKLKLITNRGVKVYPDGNPATFCTDHWRCRFVGQDAVVGGETNYYTPVDYQALLDLQTRMYNRQIEIIKVENLYKFDGERAFSLGQGE